MASQCSPSPALYIDTASSPLPALDSPGASSSTPESDPPHILSTPRSGSSDPDSPAFSSSANPPGFLQAPSLLPPVDYRLPLTRRHGNCTARRAQVDIAHPYARLFAAKKDGTKRRKIWNHALEKSVFSPQEM